MLCYHLAHLLPGLCLHDCWFLFYWPIVGSRMFEGKRRIFWGGICFTWCMSLVMQTEARMWGPRDAFSSPSVCFCCILHWLAQSTSHAISCEPWYARMHFLNKNFSTALMCHIVDFLLMFFPVSYFVVFPLSFRRWSKVGVFWFDTLHAKLLWLFFSVLFNCCQLTFWQ